MLVKKLLHDRALVTKEKINDMFAVELAYINKKNPYFDPTLSLDVTEEKLNELHATLAAQISELPKKVGGKLRKNKKVNRALTDEELSNRVVLESLIQNYFEIARKTTQDLVPKTIMFWLVNYVEENVRKYSPTFTTVQIS